MKFASFALFLSLFTTLLTPPVWADDLSLEPQIAVLLLRNQQVLTGKVTRLGDFYHLTLGTNGDIRIPKADVQFMGASLEEVYQSKSTAVPPRSCDGHLLLADWCIRQKMYPQAAEQIVKAMAIKPKDPRLAQMEARLKAASEPVHATKVAIQESSAATVGREQLERISQELPTGALEKFTVVVQPILIDRCGAASCHGGGSSSGFQLVQPTQTRIPSRRFTQRNLFATLSLVNRDNVSESALLKLAREPHGGRKEASFARDEDRQYQELIDWITTITQNQYVKNEPPKSVNIRKLAGPQRQVGQTSDTPESVADSVPTPLPPLDQVSRDPFDPAPFNDRFFRR